MNSTTGAEVTALSIAALTSCESNRTCCAVNVGRGMALRVVARRMGAGARSAWEES
jgi:hypothetical protein